MIVSSSISLFVSGMHLKWKRESERMGEWENGMDMHGGKKGSTCAYPGSHAP